MMSKIKKIYFCVFLVFLFCGKVLAQSSLPECEGNDKNISKYSRKHFSKMRKWTNCHGTGMGPKGQKYIGEFYKGEFHGQGIFRHEGREYVGQYKNHKRHGQGTYTYANGDHVCWRVERSINIMEKAFTYTLMETNMLVNGKKINILPQIT